MKKSMLMLTVFCSLAFAQIDSSVKVPQSIHNLAVFGNHKNHPVQTMRIHQELQRLAPLKSDEVKTKLSAQGWRIERLMLTDIDSNLLYVGWGHDSANKVFKLFIDPTDGRIVHQEERL